MGGDDSLQTVINRIERLDDRIAQLEKKSPGWIAKIERAGIIVACVGGILGGTSTLVSLYNKWVSGPHIDVFSNKELDLSWTPDKKLLSVTQGFTFSNSGSAAGSPNPEHAYLESAPRHLKLPLEDIQVFEKQKEIKNRIVVEPDHERELQITMASALTPEQEHALFESSSTIPYDLVFEVKIPQTTRIEYCMYLGPSLVKQLRDNRYAELLNSTCKSPDQ
jgi:hypothetical protein